MTLYFAVFPMLFRFLGLGLPDMVQSDGFVMNTCLFAEGLAFSNCHALGKPTKLGGLAVRGHEASTTLVQTSGAFLGISMLLWASKTDFGVLQSLSKQLGAVQSPYP